MTCTAKLRLKTFYKFRRNHFPPNRLAIPLAAHRANTWPRKEHNACFFSTIKLLPPQIRWKKRKIETNGNVD